MQPLDSRLNDLEIRSLERGIRSIQSKEQATTPARALFGALTGQSGKQQIERWMASVNDGLTQIARDFPTVGVDGIFQNRVFQNIFAVAAEYAGGSRQPEKLNVLHNAVLNAALPGAPEERAQVIYLKVIDILTPWHFRLLRDLSQVALVDASKLDSQLPPIVKQKRFYESLVNDLEGLGLVFIVNGERTQRHAQELPVVTDQGRRFLQYISSPLGGG